MEDYSERRKEIEAFFVESNKLDDLEPQVSPSGKYSLNVSKYKTRENAWAFTRGIVKEVSTGEVIADVKRNYSHFWFCWCLHPNGNEYLLCGEDYQGQTLVNLTQKRVQNTFPNAGYDGYGFCWADVTMSPNKSIIAVEGCYWACPYDIVFFDFRNPDEFPPKELKRIESVGELKGWDEDGNFTIETEIEIRKSDGKHYDDLSEEEQDVLDADQSLVDYKSNWIKVSQEELMLELNQ